HAARLDDGHPPFRVAFAGSHTGLGRLLGHGFIREDANPHLSASADAAAHRLTGGFYLPGGNPGRLHRLQSEITELHRSTACFGTDHAAALMLTKLTSFRH